MKSQITDNALKETSVPPAEAEMASYGITRVPVDYFHYQGFRYTYLKDAVAEAKRDNLGN